MILFQVRDLAAKSCGEPHVAPSWAIAKASLGAMLAKTPELAERAKAIRVDYVCDWDPESGLLDVHTIYLDSESGDVCLDQFYESVASEENKRQAEADNDRPLEVLRKSIDGVLKKQAEGEVGQRLRDAVSEFVKGDNDA